MVNNEPIAQGNLAMSYVHYYATRPQ